MLSKLLRFAAPVVAVALFAMAPPSASATLVNYTTSGVFSGPDAILAGTALSQGGITLNFAPEVESGDTSPLGFFVGDIGTFSAVGIGSADFSGGLNSFTLTIHQTAPGGGTGASVASVTGKVTTTSGGAFVVAFDTNPITITPAGFPTTTYNLLLTDLGALGQGVSVPNPSTGSTGDLNASVTVAPLPATANMGIALLVCLAGAGVWRKLKSSQAAA